MSKLFPITVIILIVSVTTQAALFPDDFTVDSSAGWTINSSSPETSATFPFDYGFAGVPVSQANILHDIAWVLSID